MISGTAKVIIDLGNSQTRVLTKFGTNAKGKPRTVLSFLDNRYGILPADKVSVYLTDQLYSEEDSCIFNFDDGTGVQAWCNGEICNNEITMSERPTALVKKYQSNASKLAIVNAIRKSYEMVADMSDCDVENVNVDWDVVILLPPEDVDTGSALIADMVKSIKRIDFLMPCIEKEVRINTVNVYPEGFCAYIAVLLENKEKIRKGYSYLADPEEYTLIIDIGAGTTDFTLAKGNKIITSSRFTRAIGGNNVHSRVRKLLHARNISIGDQRVRTGVETGVIKSGAKTYDICEEIATAKRDVAKALIDAIVEFFEDSMTPIQSINNLLICGGGAVESENENIQPISNYMIDYMKALSPDVSLVKLPTDEDGNKISARLLNIIGAGILAA